MWKNKEIKKLICILAGIQGLALILAICYSLTLSVILAVVCFLSNAIFFYYTCKRYREIQTLSAYLMRIYANHEQLDVRDNKEGELSILKNDIYKVTQTLYEQSEYLQKDKIFLANTLSDISHQLKTPLTSMMVSCDILAQEQLPQDKQQEFIKSMHQQLERMQWLISSLLKLSRIDAKAVTFKQETINLKKLIETCLKPFSVIIEVKHIQVDKQMSDSIQVTADENWLLEAISNIIKNAIEHTPVDGTIMIASVDTPLHIKLMISNSGKMIDPIDQQHIFDRFYRGKNASSDSIGIGLSLSKSIISQMQGQITCESDEDCTRFVITFYKHVV